MEFISIQSVILIIAVATNFVLASLVYRSNPKGATNWIFSILCVLISLWLLILDLAQSATFIESSLVLTRLSIFIATPMSMMFFLLAHTLPSPTLRMKPWIIWAFFFVMVATMIVSVSPYAFTTVDTTKFPPQPQTGWGIYLFGLVSEASSFGAVYVLFRRFRKATDDERDQLRLVMQGILLMLGSITAVIFVPVLLFKRADTVAFAPLFTLIFLGMTAYAIVRHHLFSLKIIATQALVVVLWIILFAKIWVGNTSAEMLTDATVFTASLIIGILLVRSVEREVKQREELERLNTQIESKNKQLEELGRFKSELLSLASHQIRSPLGAIKGFISLIVGGSYGQVSDQAKETLKKVQHSADELISLINTLLDVRKVEEGKMEYQFAKTDLKQMMDEVIDLMSPVAAAKKLELTFDAPAGEVFVSADREKLKQVIQNLVDNAIKYTPSGFVKASLAVESGKAVATVADSGLGFSAALAPYLFEEFIRDERVKKEIRGTGLGLYIARKIVEAHAGTLNAISGGEGKGSTFVVKIPLAAK